MRESDSGNQVVFGERELLEGSVETAGSRAEEAARRVEFGIHVVDEDFFLRMIRGERDDGSHTNGILGEHVRREHFERVELPLLGHVVALRGIDAVVPRPHTRARSQRVELTGHELEEGHENVVGAHLGEMAEEVAGLDAHVGVVVVDLGVQTRTPPTS